MSRKAGAVFLILAFVSIAVLGAFGMNHGANHGGGCLAASAHGGVACPPGDAVSTSGFYLEALKGFSLATMSAWGVFAALLLLFAGWMALQHIASHIFEGALSLYLKTLQGNFLKLPERFARWLKLHERRDPALAL